MDVVRLLIACLSGIAISWLLTPFVIRLAKRVGAIDQPNERKIHIRPIPRLGGVAVFGSFSLAIAAQILLLSDWNSSWITGPEGVVFCIALVVMFLLGIWDDIRTLKPLEKFLVQLTLSSLVYVAGFKVSFVTGSFLSGLMQISAVDYMTTVLWIVGITNAVNLIDGLDGLASGVSIVAALTISAISLINNDAATATIALILAGSLIGFLRYNFNPAKVFLGDSGSLFVGFALAILSLQSSRNGVSGYSLAIPVLALGVPIIDTSLAMLRRLLKSFLPKGQAASSFLGVFKSIVSPDRSHIHHRLIARGLSHMKAVLLLYVVAFVLGLGAIAIRLSGVNDSSLILLVVAIAVMMGVSQLRYREMAILRNGIVLRFYLNLYDWQFLRRTLFQGLVDAGFIVAAFSLAYYLTNASDGLISTGNEFWFSLLVVVAVQLLVFWVSGLYKGTVHQVGVGDAVRTAKSVLFATLTSAITLSIVSRIETGEIAALFVFDFYFLLSLVVCSRFAFAALKYLFEKEHAGEKRVLIYGADSHGVLILQNILGFDSQNLTPVGFLDDDPQLEGRYLNGYPIFGGHWKLHRLLERVSVNEILLSTENIRPEALKRLKAAARSHGVVIRRFQIRLEDVSREAARTAKDQSQVEKTT